ncbi:alpha/beta hydrolase [Gramella lutea]|uniref:Alpha/beta hydrolase n=1 Tax=Christiangramia lutea TaxID=1607951 RepID=A0A9X2ABL7_9FLAO|nr:alpha/beta hydrolase [Christiangramia lutea]MCH4824366.1 alpha/beta hydrolase [Christiangramia lutea]
MRFLFTALLFTCFSVFCQDYQSFKVNDGSIAFRTYGEGDPILIINGGPGLNSTGFSELAEILSENNMTIIYDQRGTGNSALTEKSSSSFTVDLMVEDIEKLRKHLGIEQWVILGHSFGGMLAYAYAAEHPERVKGMIQSHSGGMSLQNTGRFDIRNQLEPAENDSLVRYMAKAQIKPGNLIIEKKRALYMAKAYLYEAEHEATVAERLLQVDREVNSMVWSNMRALNFDKTSEMKVFTNPVLILHGLQDVVPMEIAEKADSILPNSELVKIDRCGHYGWLDRPEIYLKEIKAFLSNNS